MTHPSTKRHKQVLPSVPPPLLINWEKAASSESTPTDSFSIVSSHSNRFIQLNIWPCQFTQENIFLKREGLLPFLINEYLQPIGSCLYAPYSLLSVLVTLMHKSPFSWLSNHPIRNYLHRRFYGCIEKRFFEADWRLNSPRRGRRHCDAERSGRPEIQLKIEGAKETTTICPYCSVGCGMIVHTQGGKVINVEGDPDIPSTKARSAPRGPRSISCATTRPA